MLFHFHRGAQVRDPGSVSRVCYYEGHGVLDPVVRGAVSVVRCSGERVLAGAEVAAKVEQRFQAVAESEAPSCGALKLGVCTVNVQTDARANHDSDYGIVDGRLVTNMYAHSHGFTTLPHQSRFA